PAAVWAMGVSMAVATTWLVLAMHRRLGVSTPEWAWRTAAPRMAVPLAVAIALSFVPWGAAVTRPAALTRVVLQGAAYVAAVAALTWPTGDARLVLARVGALGRARARA